MVVGGVGVVAVGVSVTASVDSAVAFTVVGSEVLTVADVVTVDVSFDAVVVWVVAVAVAPV